MVVERALRLALVMVVAGALALAPGLAAGAVKDVIGLDSLTHPNPEMYYSADTPVVEWEPYAVASIDTSDAIALDVQGDYLYIARGGEGSQHGGFHIYDVSDPENPAYVDSVQANNTPSSDILVVGDAIYFDTGEFIQSWEWDPAGAWGFGGFLFGGGGRNPGAMAIAGDIMYVSDYSNRTLTSLDLAASATLDVTSTVGQADGVVVDGDFCYVPTRSGGIEIFDASEPGTLTPAATIPPQLSMSEDVAIAGNVAYVVDHGGGIASYDVSNPFSPSLITSATFDSRGWGIDIQGDVAFVASGNGGCLEVFDISNPSDLVAMPHYADVGVAYDVEVAGDYAYVASAGSAVQIIRISEFEAAEHLEVYTPVTKTFTGIDIEGDTIYATDLAGTFYALSGSNPWVILPKDTLSGGPFTALNDVAVDGDVAYVCEESGALISVNVADPTSLSVLGGFPGLNQANGIDLTGDTAFVADGTVGGLQVVDVTDPVVPVPIGSLNTTGSAQQVDVQGDIAYVADGNEGLVCIDVSDPTSPVYLGSATTTGYAADVVVDGFVAYVPVWFQGLVCFDVSDPANPVEIGRFPAAHGMGVDVDGDYAYLGAGGAGLYILDVSDPSDPTQLGLEPTGATIGAVAAHGDITYYCQRGVTAGGLHSTRTRWITDGWSTAFDQTSNTTPDFISDTTTSSLEVGPLADGTYYAHVRATRFRAGSDVGPVEHRKIMVSQGTSYEALWGGNRYETAVRISEEAFPGGATTVVIATGENWPDALGGAAFAAAKAGPILLTEQDSLPSVVLQEIRDLGATEAYILGGTAAVSQAVEDVLDAELGAADVHRLQGDDRFETAEAIADATAAEYGIGFDGKAFVATSDSFPDALAASPIAAAWGWPIYLTEPDAIRASTVSKMKGDGVTEVFVLGGTGAVSAGVKSTLNSEFSSATRLSGNNRYDTAATIASYAVDTLSHTWDGLAIATGEDFPDALSGGVLQGRALSVLLLTDRDALSPDTRTTLSQKRGFIADVTYLGGTGAVSQTVRDEISGVLR